MSFFQQIEGEAAVLVHKGVYKQVPIYKRDGYLYAKVGSGFVRLMADGSTSGLGLRLEFMSWGPEPLCRDKFGRLCTHDRIDAISLPGEVSNRILGAPHESDR